MGQFSKFEEYKLFVDDTARFTDRRLSVTNIFVAINSILLSAVALLVKDAGLKNWVIALSTIAVLIAGITISFVLVPTYHEI